MNFTFFQHGERLQKETLFLNMRNWWKSKFGFQTKQQLERNEDIFHKRWFYKVNRLSLSKAFKTVGCEVKKCIALDKKWISCWLESEDRLELKTILKMQHRKLILVNCICLSIEIERKFSNMSRHNLRLTKEIVHSVSRGKQWTFNGSF